MLVGPPKEKKAFDHQVRGGKGSYLCGPFVFLIRRFFSPLHLLLLALVALVAAVLPRRAAALGSGIITAVVAARVAAVVVVVAVPSRDRGGRVEAGESLPLTVHGRGGIAFAGVSSDPSRSPAFRAREGASVPVPVPLCPRLPNASKFRAGIRQKGHRSSCPLQPPHIKLPWLWWLVA